MLTNVNWIRDAANVVANPALVAMDPGLASLRDAPRDDGGA